MRRRVPTPALAAILIFPMTAFTKVAQDGKEIDSQDRREGMERSQITHTMHFLTDLQAAPDWNSKS